MVYDHAVIKNGILYPAGEEVPENVSKKTVEAEQVTVEKAVKRGRPTKSEE